MVMHELEDLKTNAFHIFTTILREAANGVEVFHFVTSRGCVIARLSSPKQPSSGNGESRAEKVYSVTDLSRSAYSICMGKLTDPQVPVVITYNGQRIGEICIPPLNEEYMRKGN